MKIIFMGTPNFAVPILRSIYDSGHKILEVYTQPATKSGRGQKINHSDIFKCAEQLNLKVRSPDTLETVQEINHIKKLKPDLVVVVAYGKILPTKLLNIDKLTFINAHASLLPKWRGAAPIQRAIMNMDSETGVSVMKIIPQLDAGPVMLQRRIKISQEMSYENLSKKMSEIAAELILDSIKLIENNKAIFIEQTESEVTYAKKIQKNEARINWNESAKKIVAKINALHPNPGCWFQLSDARIKIIKAIEIKKAGEVGTIIDNKMTIACSKNAVQILELKKEGKKQMSVDEYLKGNEIRSGQKVN
jgi:methionyl-tRNA formyltransferase